MGGGEVVWRTIGKSVRGPSHVNKGTPCQDQHGTTILGNSPNDTLVTCVADGAGSAEYGEEGAQIACGAVLQGAAKHFESECHFDHLDVDHLIHWCETARQQIGELANQRDCPPRQFATTLCVAILSPRHAFFFQIGDGAIVLGTRDTYGVVFWPQSGEYANSTNFLTAENFRVRLEFCVADRNFTEVALFTDGLERVALQFHSQTPHPPFFQPLFSALQNDTPSAALEESLSHFLQSKAMQLRSDDDKSLILASRLPDRGSAHD